jgi:1,4-alpha-glucan branching enzyme
VDDFGTRVAALFAARNADPFGLLGPHPMDSPQGRLWSIRAFQPRAVEAQIILQGQTNPIPMRRLRDTGFYEATLPTPSDVAPAPSSYRLRFRNEYGDVWEAHDTYAFPYLLSEFDLYLMGEGRHYDTYEKLGAHVKTLEGVIGVHFAVWAPNARRHALARQFGYLGALRP